MLALKDPIDLDDYTYNVCEISGCDEEATDLYEDEDYIVNVCDKHYRELDNNRYSW